MSLRLATCSILLRSSQLVDSLFSRPLVWELARTIEHDLAYARCWSAPTLGKFQSTAMLDSNEARNMIEELKVRREMALVIELMVRVA